VWSLPPRLQAHVCGEVAAEHVLAEVRELALQVDKNFPFS